MMSENVEQNNNVFRINTLTIFGHPILKNIHVDLCQINAHTDELYTTVVIGANGIGKSFLLKSITEIFCCLENLHLSQKPTTPQYYFSIEYTCRGKSMVFANYSDVNAINDSRRKYTLFVFKINGKDAQAESMELPKRVIATATTISDKFLAKSTQTYRYKGLRNENSPSTTGTRTLVRKTVTGLLNSLDEKSGFKKELKNLLEQLDLLPKLELSYTIRYKSIFVTKDISSAKLIHIFEHQSEYFGKRNSDIWGTQRFRKLLKENEQKIDEVALFLRQLYEKGFDDGKNCLKYDLLSDSYEFSLEKDALNTLSQLDLLSYPSLSVFKHNKNYSFEQSSSGESNLLCQFVSIMSDIEPHSLILIDEPENSAHPNWQISYIGWLKKIFRRYYDCHFIISTHSHFMLTDIEPESSDIVALEKQDNGEIKDVSEGTNTFNWSVDDILYRVFHVRNTRNYVLESKSIDLYQMVSNRVNDKEKIQTLIQELSRFILNEEDPLLKLLNTAIAYVETI